MGKHSLLRALLASTASVAYNVLKGKGTGETERVSVWSITKNETWIFYRMIFITWAIVLAWVVGDEMSKEMHTTTPELLERILDRFGPKVLPTAAIGMMVSAAIMTAVAAALITRRVAMTILDRITERLNRPIIAKGVAEGEARGIALGIEWATRKAEAEARGIPFDEPPPTPDTPVQ